MIVFILTQGLSVLALLWVRSLVEPGWLRSLMLGLAVLDLVTILPSFVVLRQRMKEIDRGELDEARKY